MDVSAVVGTVLGLAALFWILATACSYALEVWSSLRNIRGKALGNFVADMIDGSTILQYAPLTNALLDSDLLRAYKKPTYKLTGEGTTPSYLPSVDFATALLTLTNEMFLRTPSGQIYLWSNADVPPLARQRALEAIDSVQAGSWTAESLHVLVENARPAFRKWFGEPGNTALNVLIQEGLDKHNHSVVSGNTPLGFLLQGLIVEASVRACLVSEVAAKMQSGQLAAFLSGSDGSPPAIPSGASTPEAIADLLRNRAKASVSRLHLGSLRAAVASGFLPERLSGALSTLLNAGAQHIEDVRQGVATWYDGVMERASGWYKRRSMVCLAVIAIIPTVALDLDAIDVGKHLLSNVDARSEAERNAIAIWEDQAKLTQTVQNGVWPAIGSRTATLGPALSGTKSYAEFSADERVRARGEVRMLLLSEASRPEFASVVALAVAADGVPVADRALSLPAWRLVLEAFATACTDVGEAEPACGTETARPLWKGTDTSKARDEKAVITFAEGFWDPNAAIVRRSSTLVPAVRGFLEAQDDESKTKFLGAVRAEYAERTESVKKLLNPFLQRDSLSERWKKAEGFWRSLLFVGLLLLGYLVTCLMVSLGAPFWYELIGKIVNTRATGDRPSPAHTT